MYLATLKYKTMGELGTNIVVRRINVTVCPMTCGKQTIVDHVEKFKKQLPFIVSMLKFKLKSAFVHKTLKYQFKLFIF